MHLLHFSLLWVIPNKYIGFMSVFDQINQMAQISHQKVLEGF